MARRRSPSPRKPAAATAIEQDHLHLQHEPVRMDVPNQFVPLERSGQTTLSRQSPRYRWPLVLLSRPVDDDSRDAVPVFVASRHGAKMHEDWPDTPPTWMDPEVFVDMCKDIPAVTALLRDAVQRNSRKISPQLRKILDDVFDTQYLPWLIEQFEHQARELFAQWLLRNAVYEQQDR